MTRNTRIALTLGLGVPFLIITGLWAIPVMLVGYLTGYYTGPRANASFLEAHQRAIVTFVENEGFGISRFRPARFWNELYINLEGGTYHSEDIHLIGLTPEKGDRYFCSPSRKSKLPSSPTRPLTGEESAAVAKLRTREVPYVKLKSADPEQAWKVHVLAPLWAEKSCLECHDVSEGSLLGAFDYSLIDTQPEPESSLPKQTAAIR